MDETPPFALDGARSLLGDAFARVSIAVEGSRIAALGSGRRVDCTGFLVLPGIVDLHGDGFERHLAPRRGALRSLEHGLRAVEAELVANGITTAWLAQSWSWEGGMRGPDFARTLCAALAEQGATLDMRVLLRLDIACHDDFDAVRALVARYGIDYLALNDHLPHAALAQGKRPPRLDGQAIRAGRSPADHLALMRRLHDEMPVARGKLGALLATLTDTHIASHDDDTPDRRVANRALGATIAEFPTTRAATLAARTAGDTVILGAPNVVRGGSHDRGVSAREMIEEGACDALASDYHYPSLHHAAFALEEAGMPLAEAWALISSSPARIMGLDDRATLAPGKRADIVIVEEETRRIVGTLAAGRFAYVADPLAARLLAAR